MPQKTNPADYYLRNLEEYGQQLIKLTHKKRLYGWLRLLAFIAAIFLISLTWQFGSAAVAAVFIIMLAIFLFLVSKDLANQKAIDHLEELVDINKKEQQYLLHHYTHQKEGLEFSNADHPYADDMDIFGRASLFQYINRARSEQGIHLIAHWLSQPSSPEIIIQRQNAVRELSEKTVWRQELQALCKESPVNIKAEKTVELWLQEKNQFIHKTFWQLLRFVIPALAIGSVAAYITDLIIYPQFMILLAVFYVIAFSITKKVSPAYSKLDKITKEIDTLARSIAFLEQSSFRNEFLNTLKKDLAHDAITASRSIHQLNGILNRFDYRLNPFIFLPLNILLLWDLQLVFQLEKWKQENTSSVSHWFSTLANFECLSSLGTLAFNHPGWCYPELAESAPEFTAAGLGHPLIDPAKSVLNSFSTKGEGQVSIITGSNMAGKSTFLRSVGVNMVLACMGAPVCAQQLIFSPLKLMSSMRVKDNLEESTSTFYAELKKLKTIIDAVKAKEQVFILLDEILRGTNSHDRHTGSKSLIRQLVHEHATGIIATHDLELASLENESPASIHNYHFDVQIDGDELYFDYTLKSGICQSFNASILMKKIGLEL